MPDQPDHNQLARCQQAQPDAMPDQPSAVWGLWGPADEPVLCTSPEDLLSYSAGRVGTVAAVDAVFCEFGIDSWSSRLGSVTASIPRSWTAETVAFLRRALEGVLPVGVAIYLVRE